MKPHALRKLLWLGNVGLAVGAVAAFAHCVLRVTPATAAPIAQQSDEMSPTWQAKHDVVFEDYKRRINEPYEPNPPVTVEEVQSIFLERWTKPRRERKHFPFVGPLPPPIAQVTPIGPPEPPEPTGLETLGDPVGLCGASALLFAFSNGETEAFRVGEWIREPGSTSRRFKLRGISPVADVPYTWAVKYSAHGNGPEVQRQVAFTNPWDFGLHKGLMRDASAVAREEAEADEATQREQSRVPTRHASVPVTLTEAKPKVIPYDKQHKAVVFTQRTYDFFRGKHAAMLAPSVKTEIAKRGGRVVGLRITGFGNDFSGELFDVKRGDILVSVNGVPVRDRAAIVALVHQLPQEQLVTVVLLRRGKEVTYRVDPRNPKNRRELRYFENLPVPRDG